MKMPEDKLDLIIEILHQHDKRFEQIDKHFEQIEQARAEDKREWQQARAEDKQEAKERYQELREDLKEIKYDLRLDKEKLQEVYESRDRVTVNFTRAWATASFFIALISSTIILAVAKAF